MPPEYTLPQANPAKPQPAPLESRLEERIASLEKRNRILTVSCGAACLLAVYAAGFRSTKEATAAQGRDRVVVDEIVAGKLVAGLVHVIDADGQAVFVAGSAKSSGGYALAKSGDTKEFARLDQHGVTAYDANGVERAKIQSGGANGPGMHLKDEAGVLRAGFTVDQGGAVLEFTDPRAETLMNIGVRGKSPVVESRTASGAKMRNTLGQ